MTDAGKNEIDPYKACMVVLEQSMKALQRGNLAAARQGLEVVAKLAKTLSGKKSSGIEALRLCCLALLEQREGTKGDAASEVKAKAMPMVDGVQVAEHSVPFHNLMSNALIDMGEYLRAIPFCERAIEMVLDWNEPTAIADLLSREGRCYTMSGLKDHAVVPLRAAVRILRNFPGDPRLPSALISLGNALRKSSPAEAEQLYKETAELHVAKLQMDSATTAWVNLGILCAEQGRLEESLRYYEQALQVRERAAGMAASRVGSLLNNMANCYRRMKELDKAIALVDRALKVLKPEDGSTYASALGTKGQILHDAERDDEAVEWLRKSYLQRYQTGSPDLDAVIENLGIEIDSLKRLGRAEEAAQAEGKLAAAQAVKNVGRSGGVDVSQLKVDSLGMLQIDLAFGSSLGSPYGIRDAEVAAGQIKEILEEQDVGSYSGRVVIPETTTLIYRGENGEAMFAAIEQYLNDHLICAGALVTIRQGQSTRVVTVPQVVQ